MLTDSGGVQEETSALGVRCFTLRDTTERAGHGRARDEQGARRGPDRIAEIPGNLETPKPGSQIPLWDGRCGRQRRRSVLGFLSGRRATVEAAARCAASSARSSSTATAFAVTEPYIRRMRDTMVHRGPDGAGVWVSDDGRVGLGHRRLSIIDLSDAAIQPMANEDGSLRLRLQRRDLQPRRDPRRAGGDRRPRLADRPLRHRGDPARLRRVGHRLPPALPRHVRVRDLGRAHAGAVAGARPHRHQAALLQRPPRPDRRSRSEIKALLEDPAAGARRRRGGALSTTCRS